MALSSTTDTAASSSNTLRAFLAPMLPYFKDSLPTLLDGTIPAAYGNCSVDKKPPQPCVGSSDLLVTKGFFYSIRARWIGGLDSIRYDTFDVAFDRSGTMLLTLAVRFDALPLSVAVGACLGDFCGTVVDSTDTCCGSNKTVTFVVRLPCCPSPPFLCQPSSVVSVKVAPAVKAVVSVGVGWLSTKVDVWDLTSTVEHILVRQVQHVLLAQILAQINGILAEAIGDSVVCGDSA